MSTFTDNFDTTASPSLMSTFGDSFSMSTGADTQTITGVMSSNNAEHVDESGFVIERDVAEIVLRASDVVIPIEAGTVLCRTVAGRDVRWIVYAEGVESPVRYQDEQSRLFVAVRVKRLGERAVAS